MSILKQTNDVEIVLSETDLKAEFTEAVKELNVSGFMLRETETNIGTFDSRLVDEDDNNFQITLYIGAKIAKKEVEHEKQ
jgi:hypothetical protein